MDVRVTTGTTKSPRDASVYAVSHVSAQGEKVLLIMEIQARKAEAKTLELECEAIVKHALLETEGDAAQRLDGTLKELNGLFKGLLVSKSVDDVHMIVAILDTTNTFHASHAGRAEAYLVRKGVAAQITEYTGGKPMPAFVHISSGQLEPRDTIVCSTQRLLRTLTPAQLAQLSLQEGKLVDNVVRALEADAEYAAIGVVACPATAESAAGHMRTVTRSAPARARRGGSAMSAGAVIASIQSFVSSIPFGEVPKLLAKLTGGKGGSSSGGGSRRAKSSLKILDTARSALTAFFADLAHPKRKRRAHLLLLAMAVALLIVIWAIVHAFTFSQRSKSRAELEELVEQITQSIQVADNQRLMGNVDKANEILQNAETSAKQVIDNESGLFRVEAGNLLGTIRAKREEINNVVRVSAPTVSANISAKSPGVTAEGLIGVGDGELVAYDRQDYYRILLNTVEDPVRVSEDQLILDGEYVSRNQSFVFLTTGNGVVEVTGGEAQTMKTDDAAGWANGTDIETYLRFVYILAPESKQIYKYERLTNRYGAPSQYNVNGDLTGALDMTIDGDVYVLKEDGTIVRLFRGENQPFKILRAPDDLLTNAKSFIKLPEKSFYILDPVDNRIIVLSHPTTTGESTYLKQIVIEGDQVGELKDIYVDPEESRLYVMDEKRVYVVDLSTTVTTNTAPVPTKVPR